MPDTTLSQALREAYASAPTGVITYITLELIHTLLTEPIRVCCGMDDIDATLEEDAPRNPGETVFFKGYPFDLQLPEVSTTALPTAQLVIDNIDRAIVGALEQTLVSTEPITAIIREYLSTDLSMPQNDPPMRLQVTDARATTASVTAQLGFPNYANRRFPRDAYTSEVFPSLAS